MSRSSGEKPNVPIPDALLPTLRATLARLVPTDQDPGALDLGAEAFIQARIAENPDIQVLYERGLTALYEQSFPALTPEEQDSILQSFETRYPEFLTLTAQHAVEAVYSQPAGWQMVGFEVTL
jgi:hypothetical protein